MNPDELSRQFIRWQCRIRQYSVRKDQGRPSCGMRPRLVVNSQDVGDVTVVLSKSESADLTRQFKYIYQKTQDPADRYQQAIKLLSEYYYQVPEEFSGEMMAVYPAGSAFVERAARIGEGCLIFEQGNQRYAIDCRIRDIPEAEPKYQAAFWHNRLFNPNMGNTTKILGFAPDWKTSEFMELDLLHADDPA
ncbi:MAG: hypothetical protein OXF73_13295 [Gammaproteobacteria bacterium]|nr:hypothetical protein [Gammaproteobacteria bacterium]MCY4227789.1 hypothetical protein [Gammaproteobacteria bacterium]